MVSDERQPTHPHDVICSNRRENVGCIDVGKRGDGDGIGRVQVYYRGRDMILVHKGMRINESDWNVFLGHAAATLAKFQVPDAEQREVVAFVQSIKKECVESDST